MSKIKLKKISAFLPEQLLTEAVAAAQHNQTDTIIAALQELVQKHRRVKALKSLRKFHIEYDVDTIRERKVM